MMGVMTCKSGAVTRRVKSLPEIIVISGDQLKSHENIPEYLTTNEESSLFILVLVTLFTSELDHFSNFRFCSSAWPHYDGLASIKTEMMKRPTILNGEKLGFLIYASKKLFCSSNERKMECPPEETTIDFTNYNRIFLRRFYAI